MEMAAASPFSVFHINEAAVLGGQPAGRDASSAAAGGSWSSLGLSCFAPSFLLLFKQRAGRCCHRAPLHVTEEGIRGDTTERSVRARAAAREGAKKGKARQGVAATAAKDGACASDRARRAGESRKEGWGVG